MARTKNPSEATRKSWKTRKRNAKKAAGYRTAAQAKESNPQASKGDYARMGKPAARQLLASLNREGGFTYHAVSKRSPKAGFIVSTNPERSQGVDAADLTPDMLRKYAKANRDLLKKPGNYFGGWRDGDRVYLDVSTVVKSKTEAVRLGKEHDQIGVFDISTGETVVVDEHAQSGGAAHG